MHAALARIAAAAGNPRPSLHPATRPARGPITGEVVMIVVSFVMIVVSVTRISQNRAPTTRQQSTGSFLFPAIVRHKTDMPTALRNVRSQGQSGKHMLALRFSAFGPIGHELFITEIDDDTWLRAPAGLF
jgi:hypothetical protein